MSNSTIRNAVRFALTAGVAASFVNAPAFAADDDDSTKLDRVEVTGSRIKRTQLEGAMPVTSVTREDIDKTGLASIGDLLQELPAAGAALNTNFNNGGDGSTRVDLRNLGSNRVLVLVNGRRWVNITGGSGSVDLNTIPISIIERVEVLKDGASAVYGSDAIAGVINIITRKDFDGAAANAQIGEYDEGDGRQEYYDFSVGSSGSRSSAFFNASYFNGQPVHAGDRDVSKEPLFGTTNTLGSSTTPYGRFRVSDAAGELGGAFSIFSGAGATRNTSDALNTVPVPGSFFAYNPSFAYNFAPDNYLTTPSERWSIFAQARFDITDNVTFTTDALYNKRISEQLLAAMPVIVGALGNLADGAPIGIDVSNPYNFFGMTLSPTASATNFTDGILRANSIQRRFVETGGRSFNQDVATYRFGGGFEGNFEAVGRVWDWSAHYTFTQTTEMDITYGLLNTARLRTALGPVAACTGACVPLNMFGGVGTITQGMLDWVTFNAHDDLGTTTRGYTGNISGEIFDLPAGPVGIAVGYEYRQEEGFDDPDALIAAGNTTGNARSPTVGSYSLSEFYAEFAIPLLKDAPLAEDLELQLAFRSSDYTTFGSTTNMKLGIRWQPFNDLLVRGTYQEGFRAPSIAELYLGRSDSFPNLTDPCSVAATNGGPGAAGGLDPTPDDAAESQLLANCTNTAVTNGFGSFTPDAGIVAATTNVFVPAAGFVAANMYGQSNTQIRITVGGNPNLSPETATSTTFGFVYSPSYVDGLSLSLDWYKIELEEAIAGVGTATIAAACYVGGQTSFCNLIDRLPTGDIDDFFSGNTNVSTLTAQGVDLNVVYRAGELPLVPGEWKFTWDTAYVQKLEQCDLDPLTLGLTCNNFVQINVGDGSVPRFKSNLDIDWTWGDWEATWRMRFIGRQYEFCSSTAAYFGFPCSNATSSSSGTNAMGATTYHSVQVSYNVSDWDTRFTFGILNVGDKEPPLSAQAFANSFDATTYEVPGMFPYIRISKQF